MLAFLGNDASGEKNREWGAVAVFIMWLDEQDAWTATGLSCVYGQEASEGHRQRLYSNTVEHHIMKTSDRIPENVHVDEESLVESKFFMTPVSQHL